MGGGERGPGGGGKFEKLDYKNATKHKMGAHRFSHYTIVRISKKYESNKPLCTLNFCVSINKSLKVAFK
jgi:hypothetical protein